jgi:signal transduction histidine kinase/ligand-binding sensor domain-containing protein
MKVQSCFRFSLVVKILILLLSSSILPVSLTTHIAGAHPYANFEHLSIADGLSQSTISCMLQDNEGYIWFGTRDGLNRFDGMEFTIYRHNPSANDSISDNYITSIFEDEHNIIWIGTFDGGLNRYNAVSNNFTHYRPSEFDTNGVGNDSVMAICGGARGSLLIGTSKGLIIFDQETEALYPIPNQETVPNILSNTAVSSLFKDTSGDIWIGTNSGLFKLDTATNEYSYHELSHTTTGDPQSNHINCIYQGQDNLLWIGTANGLYKLDQQRVVQSYYIHHSEDPQSLSNNRIRAICQDRNGILWLGTSYGLNKFDPVTGVSLHFLHDSGNPISISSNVIWSLMLDNSGILWLGTFNGGIDKYVEKRQVFIRYQNNPGDTSSLSNNIVKALYEAFDSTIWIGTLGGLNHLDPTTHKFTCYQNDPNDQRSLSNNTVKAICQTFDGSIWVGTSGGLNRLNPTTGEFTRYRHDPTNPNSISSNLIWSLFVDSSGKLWVGTHRGLDKLNPTTGIFTHYIRDKETGTEIVYDIVEDDNGYLWLGTSNGLARYYLNDDEFIFYGYDVDSTLNSSGYSVRSIIQATNATIWIGTNMGVFSHNLSTQTYTHYTEEHALANNTVYGILEDNSGNIWMSTNKGLSCFNPGSQIFTNYDAADGLQSDEFCEGAYLKDQTGRLYFGGINGFNVFNPSQIVDSDFYPPVVITSFNLIDGEKLLDKPFAEVSELVFNHQQNSFSVGFAVLDFTAPHKNQYAYKLQGFDKEWRYSDANNRQISYTNLDPGSYSLWVRGANSSGIWNNAGIVLDIKIIPPFWQSWWFIALISSLFAFVVFKGIRMRFQAVTRQKLKLEALVHQRTDQLQQALDGHMKTEKKLEEEMERRIEFTRALVHELKTPITTLSVTSDLFSEEAFEEPFISLSQSINRGVDNLSKRSDELLDLARGEIGALGIKPKVVNVNIILSNLKSDQAKVAASKNIDLQFDVQAKLPRIYLDGDRISQVLVNLIDNAFKYSPTGGRVIVSVREEDGNLVFRVSDQGRGISKKRQAHIFESGYQLKKDHQRFGGLGLGLMLSKLLVELHGGTIWVDSKTNKGSVFGFSIPIHQVNP